ncbi:hypothetical protein POX_a00972 [Penicillium oxalicum]|uniref:hypothetical protein n=1 Tax=Penicillium oxalicum TaxID=69781 RepID=UPI0020B643F6|nr:hypothetical protein POX_a00972 [Penicillium oxalicum]KAI2794373.1 hypothetical protein POX_a00972 [Penicillium oxalicum]
MGPPKKRRLRNSTIDSLAIINQISGGADSSRRNTIHIAPTSTPSRSLTSGVHNLTHEFRNATDFHQPGSEPPPKRQLRSRAIHSAPREDIGAPEIRLSQSSASEEEVYSETRSDDDSVDEQYDDPGQNDSAVPGSEEAFEDGRHHEDVDDEAYSAGNDPLPNSIQLMSDDSEPLAGDPSDYETAQSDSLPNSSRAAPQSRGIAMSKNQRARSTRQRSNVDLMTALDFNFYDSDCDAQEEESVPGESGGGIVRARQLEAAALADVETDKLAGGFRKKTLPQTLNKTRVNPFQECPQASDADESDSGQSEPKLNNRSSTVHRPKVQVSNSKAQNIQGVVSQAPEIQNSDIHELAGSESNVRVSGTRDSVVQKQNDPAPIVQIPVVQIPGVKPSWEESDSPAPGSPESDSSESNLQEPGSPESTSPVPDAPVTEFQESEVQEAGLPTINGNEPNPHKNEVRKLRRWLAEQIETSPQGALWEIVQSTRRVLRHAMTQPMPECLRGADSEITEMRQLYYEITNDARISNRTQKKLLNLCHAIRTEAQWIFEYAAEEVPEETGEGARLLDQFEAYVLGRLITIVEFGYKTYVTKQICNYAKTSYLRETKARSKAILLPLKRLIQYVETGDLDTSRTSSRVSSSSRPLRSSQASISHSQDESSGFPRWSQSTQSDLHSSWRTWSVDEEDALRESVHLFSGECEDKSDLIPLIISHFGDRLRRRTFRDIEAKLDEFHSLS